ncbi:MAG: hypothetical protein IPK82_31480 [Polyangiaceae bacterium]|nr:hypothetical protein [Polyangiaceae bacterium]
MSRVYTTVERSHGVIPAARAFSATALQGWGLLLGAAVAFVGCGEPSSGVSGAHSGASSGGPATSASGAPSASAGSLAGPSTAGASASASASGSAASTGQLLRPPGVSASREEREKAALGILTGKSQPGDLPMADLTPGEDFEPMLRAAMSWPMEIRLDSVVVESLDEGRTKQALDNGKMRFRLCYVPGLRSNPNLQGRIGVRVSWKAAGESANVENMGTDVPDVGVVQCAVRAMKKIAFPAPARFPASASITLQFLP